MKPSGAHTHPDHGGGSAALVVLAVIVGAAIVGPIVSAVSSLLRIVVEVLEILIIVVASAVGLAAITALAFLVIRLHRHHVQTMAAVLARQLPHVIQTSGAAELSSPSSHSEPRAVDDRTDSHRLAIDAAPRAYQPRFGRKPEAADKPRTDASPG